MNDDARVLRSFVDNLRIVIGKDPLYDDRAEATDADRFVGFGVVGHEYLDDGGQVPRCAALP